MADDSNNDNDNNNSGHKRKRQKVILKKYPNSQPSPPNFLWIFHLRDNSGGGRPRETKVSELKPHRAPTQTYYNINLNPFPFVMIPADTKIELVEVQYVVSGKMKVCEDAKLELRYNDMYPDYNIYTLENIKFQGATTKKQVTATIYFKKMQEDTVYHFTLPQIWVCKKPRDDSRLNDRWITEQMEQEPQNQSDLTLQEYLTAANIVSTQQDSAVQQTVNNTNNSAPSPQTELSPFYLGSLYPGGQPVGQGIGVSLYGSFGDRPALEVLFDDQRRDFDCGPNVILTVSAMATEPRTSMVTVQYGGVSIPHAIPYKYMDIETYKNYKPHLSTPSPPDEPDSHKDNQEPPFTPGHGNMPLANANSSQQTVFGAQQNYGSQIDRSLKHPLYAASQKLGTVDITDQFGYQPLHEVSYVGVLDAVKDLIERGADVNARDSNLRTPLSWAVQRGHREVAEYLIDHGAHVDLADAFGFTPLHVAFINDHVNVAEMLLYWGADSTRLAYDTFGMLECSGLSLQDFVVRFGNNLTAAECIIIIDDFEERSVPKEVTLHFFQFDFSTRNMVVVDHPGLEHAIFGQPLNPFPYIKCPKGIPIEWFSAAYKVEPNSAYPLEKYDWDLTYRWIVDEEHNMYMFDHIVPQHLGLTHITLYFKWNNNLHSITLPPFTVGPESWNFELNTKLIGVEPSFQFFKRHEKVLLTGLFSRTPARSVYFGSKKADIISYERTSIHVASPIFEEPTQVEIALCCGNLAFQSSGYYVYQSEDKDNTKISTQGIPNKIQDTPLYDARDAGPNITDEFGYTPLHEVSFLGLEDAVKDLIVRGANVNARDCDGRTPLFWAVQCAHQKIAQTLLESGAVVDLADANNITPLRVANFYQYRDAVQLLQHHQARTMLAVDSRMHLTGSAMIERITKYLPAIAGFVPETGSPGQIVTVNGSHLDKLSYLDLGGHELQLIPIDSTQVRIVVPSMKPGTYPVILVFHDLDYKMAFQTDPVKFTIV